MGGFGASKVARGRRWYMGSRRVAERDGEAGPDVGELELALAEVGSDGWRSFFFTVEDEVKM